MNLNDYSDTKTSKEKKEITYEFRKRFQDSFTEDIYNELQKVCKSSKSYEQVFQEIQKPTKWADELQIRHASNVLNINVLFMDLRKKKAYCGVHSNKLMYATRQSSMSEIPTIIVAWINNEHFEPIVRLDDIEAGNLRTMFKYPEDREFLDALITKYKQTCL